MAKETVHADLLGQTKNQIRKLVAEIAELAESDIQPAEFQVEFLNRIIAAVAAPGGALWMLDETNGNLGLRYHVGFQQAGLFQDRQRAQSHDALLACMLRPQIIPPGATVDGVPGAGNPTQFALILAPLTVDKQVVGLVEILMDPTRRAATQKSTVRFVSDLCDLAVQYFKRRKKLSEPEFLLVGVVESIADPEHGGRVRVRIDRPPNDPLVQWARVLRASVGDPVALRPNIGDEVLVGFPRGDLRHPVVLGGLSEGTRELAPARPDLIDRVTTRAEEILGDRERAEGWLRDANLALGGVTPLSLLDTEDGAGRVEAILGRIEWGVYS